MTLYLFIGLFVAIILMVVVTLSVQPEIPTNVPDPNDLRRGIQRRQP